MRRALMVCGNWKCNPPTLASVSALTSGLAGLTLPAGSSVEVRVAPSTIHLLTVRDGLAQAGSPVLVGSQDCWPKESGAMTGETSASMVADAGLTFSIVGHSERRANGETSAFVGEKASFAAQQGLTVLACVGEDQKARESGAYRDVVAKQLGGYLAALGDDAALWAKIVVAYEPVWAIGTGLTASPEQAQETNAYVREWLGENVGAAVAAETRVLYGGSVNAANCDELIAMDDIDGFLVGGASLKIDEFARIVAAATNAA